MKITCFKIRRTSPSSTMSSDERVCNEISQRTYNIMYHPDSLNTYIYLQSANPVGNNPLGLSGVTRKSPCTSQYVVSSPMVLKASKHYGNLTWCCTGVVLGGGEGNKEKKSDARVKGHVSVADSYYYHLHASTLLEFFSITIFFHESQVCLFFRRQHDFVLVSVFSCSYPPLLPSAIYRSALRAFHVSYTARFRCADPGYTRFPVIRGGGGLLTARRSLGARRRTYIITLYSVPRWFTHWLYL